MLVSDLVHDGKFALANLLQFLVFLVDIDVLCLVDEELEPLVVLSLACCVEVKLLEILMFVVNLNLHAVLNVVHDITPLDVVHVAWRIIILGIEFDQSMLFKYKISLDMFSRFSSNLCQVALIHWFVLCKH